MPLEKRQREWPAIGNDQAIEFLDRSLASGNISQTYIFIGPEDLGKSTIALAFARHLQGGQGGFNSDLHILEAEDDKKTIGIEATREFIKILSLSSFLDSYKIGLIKEADSLSEEAKSALLKTLEEPKDKVVIILLVKTEDSLPATILSRAQKLYFYPVSATTIYDYLIENYQTNRSLAKDLASLALGRPLRAIRYLEHPEEYREYLERAGAFLKLFGQDLNVRLATLDSFFTDRTYSKQAVAAARALLLMAEGLLRDLLLLAVGLNDRLQHTALLTELEAALAAFPGESDEKVRALLASLKLISQADEYLASNVNPRLVLEQLFISL